MDTLPPLSFSPVYKDYIWGGDRIPRVFGRAAGPGIYAESWEVSDRPEGMSVVAAGPLAGTTLRGLIEAHGQALLGRRVAGKVFPLLIKLIDAKETLSVQVHPDNEGSARHGGEPKTEMWYVLDAAPGACVYCGLREGVTPEAFVSAVAGETVEELLIKVPVKAGDAIFVPGGRVHAIGAGCLLLECQQNSNTTYRVYDWGRVGQDGKPRDLHIAQALQVIRWNDHAAPLAVPRLVESGPGFARSDVVTSPYFRMERWDLSGAARMAADDGSFRVLFVPEGEVNVCAGGVTTTLTPGRTLLVPACCAGADVSPNTASAVLLAMSVP